MSKMGKNEAARYEGASWFYRLIKEKGFEEAEKELLWRGAGNIPLHIEAAEIKRFERQIREHTVMTISCLSVLTLHDEFDFESEECARFIQRFNRKTDSLVDETTTWPDYAQVLRDELNIDVDKERRLDAEHEQLREEYRKEQHEGYC